MKKTLLAAQVAAVLTTSIAAGADDDLPLSDICGRAAIECLESNAGVVVGRPGTTAAYAAGIDDAARRFERYFGAEAPKAAVVLGEVADAGIRRSLQKLYPVVLPWLTLQDREDMVAASVRAAIQRQRPDLTGDALEAAVARSVEASLNASPGGSANEDQHQGVFSHELGHLYFIRTFWPEDELNVVDMQQGEPQRYAGPGPDWLDEIAAVMMENSVLTQSREDGLSEAAAGGDFAALWPLADYFDMTHPAFEQARQLIRARQSTAEGRAQGGVVIMRHQDMQQDSSGRDPVMFYSQSRGFADFMMETTGDERVFADIARYIAAGGTMAQWLAEHDRSTRLPATVEALEQAFEGWLLNRYAPADRAATGQSGSAG